MVSGLAASHFSSVEFGISLAALHLTADGLVAFDDCCWLGGFGAWLLLGLVAVGLGGCHVC